MPLIAQLKNKKLYIFGVLILTMLLTRGSHLLTSVSLPDASFALFFISAILLKEPKWFILLFAFSALVDIMTLSVNSSYQILINFSYLGLLPSYGMMWLAGVWLGKQTNSLDAVKFSLAALASTLVAFVISTQTYYLFSGRFPNHGILETMQYGWNYLPNHVAYTALYLVGFWLLAKASIKLNIIQSPASQTA
jgi:amino acid transporter